MDSKEQDSLVLWISQFKQWLRMILCRSYSKNKKGTKLSIFKLKKNKVPLYQKPQKWCTHLAIEGTTPIHQIPSISIPELYHHHHNYTKPHQELAQFFNQPLRALNYQSSNQRRMVFNLPEEQSIFVFAIKLDIISWSLVCLNNSLRFSHHNILTFRVPKTRRLGHKRVHRM